MNAGRTARNPRRNQATVTRYIHRIGLGRIGLSRIHVDCPPWFHILLGTVGGSLMAAAAWLAGPHEVAAGSSLTVTRLTETSYRWGLIAWFVGLVALLTAWWLARSTPRMVTTALWWGLPFVMAPILASRDAFAYANQGQLAQAGHNPYAMGPVDLPTAWLTWMDPYWQAEPAPYGPLFITLASLIVWLSGNELVLALALFRLVAVVGVLGCGYFAVRIAGRVGRSPETAWWLIVLGPLTLIHVVGGAHNDALMLTGMVAAVYLALLNRAGWSGFVLGLAVAVKATVAVVAPFLLLLALPVFSWRGLWPVLARALGGFLASFGAVTLASGLGLGWIAALGVSGKSESWLSLPTGLSIATAKLAGKFGVELPPDLVSWWRLLGLIVAAIVILAWWWRARDATLAGRITAAGWSLAAVAVLGPVMLPWYCLPALMLLAIGADRRSVTWAAVAASVFSIMVLADGHNVFAAQFFRVGLVVNIGFAVLLGWIAWRWYREGRHPGGNGRPTTGRANGDRGTDRPTGVAGSA